MTQTPERTPRPLTDCGVLIAGGTSGIGLAAAVQFAKVGVPQIAIVGRDKGRGQEARKVVLAANPRTVVEFIAGDLNDSAEAVRVCEAAHSRLGYIDVLVNSTVGPFGPRLFKDIPIEDFLPIIVQQLMAPLYTCRMVMPWMRERGGGAIVNIASDAGKVTTVGETVISAAMAGIIMFTRTFAMEVKRDGIRVNVLTPSIVTGTRTIAAVMSDAFSSKLFKGAMRAAQLGVSVPDDQAALIVFLASPQAARLTGQAISVNGGISAA